MSQMMLALCQAVLILEVVDQSPEKAKLLRHFQKTMSIVGWQQKEDLLSTLIHWAQDGCLDLVSLELLQRTLFSIEGSRTVQNLSC